MQSHHCATRIGYVLSLTVSAIFTLAPSSVRADVMSQVPADAAVVIKLNHVSESNRKLGGMFTQLGVTDLMPTLKDPLDAAILSNGMGAGVDLKSDAAMFLMTDDIAYELKHGGDRGVFLLPVSDYAAFLASGTTLRTEQETTVVQLKGEEKEMFVQHWGDYAAISFYKEELAVKHEGMKSTGVSSEQLASDDLLLYFNFLSLKKTLLPALDGGEKQLLETIDDRVADDGAKKVATAGAKQLIQMAREFLNDAQGCVLGVTIGDKGLKTCLAVDFIPDTYLGKMASTMKMAEGSVLAGLPKGRFVACAGFVYDPAWSTKLFDDLTAPIAKELPAMGEDGKKIADLIAMGHDFATSCTGGGAEAIVPDAGKVAAQEIFVFKGDAPKIKAGYGKIMDWTAPLMNGTLEMFPPFKGAGDLFKLTATPAFETVDDVSFDRYQIGIDPNNTSQMAMQMSQAFSMMYGPDGMTFVAGAADEKTFIGGMGAPESLLKDAIAAAKSGQDNLSDSLKEIDAQLPAKRAVVEYFSMSEYLTIMINSMKAQGVPLNVVLPANLPPMGFAVGSAGPSMRIDGYIPEAMIQACFQAGMQGYQQLMGGKNGGGGGL